MPSPKLTTMMSIISGRLTNKNVPFCLIGALALGLFGLPRFTADIDLMADDDFWPDISAILGQSGYTCYHKTKLFAQFDSDLNIFGKVDIMFVNSAEGKDIITRSVRVHDELMGSIPVIQPSDYLVLKLMAIANDPSRAAHDEADISEFLKLYAMQEQKNRFEDLDHERIKRFAIRFGQLPLIEKHLNAVTEIIHTHDGFKL